MCIRNPRKQPSPNCSPCCVTVTCPRRSSDRVWPVGFPWRQRN
ncbi:unnamed protein product [Dibothriocephalus latus]|uniref:Uncharacterized protein n=1 Tax=Dibothriocephalus latus TaxID=60516 RepID=A0A3P7P8E3_DIBLA|nr:unnamed protein product [Dibothriocephalus latus]